MEGENAVGYWFSNSPSRLFPFKNMYDLPLIPQRMLSKKVSDQKVFCICSQANCRHAGKVLQHYSLKVRGGGDAEYVAEIKLG